MNILKIVNGKLELRKANGSLIRTIQTSGVLNADIKNDGTLIVILTIKDRLFYEKKMVL